MTIEGSGSPQFLFTNHCDKDDDDQEGAPRHAYCHAIACKDDGAALNGTDTPTLSTESL